MQETRLEQDGAGIRFRTPGSSDYPAYIFYTAPTDTRSRQRRERVMEPPLLPSRQPSVSLRGGTAGARTFPRDVVAAHTLRLHSHFRGQAGGGRAGR